MRRLLRGLLLVVICGLPVTAAAQDPVSLSRIDGASITIDGVINEPAWQRVEPFPMTMYQPTYRGGVSQRTEVRVAYDDEYLYVSGRLYDANPEGIRTNSLYRDRYSGDDTFAIIIDPFNGHQNALWFFTTPAGVRFDMAVSNDAQGGFGDTVNQSWDTFWTSAATQNNNGWFAEMRIPLSSLGFQAEGDEVTMGLITYRFRAQSNERYIYPAIPPDWQLGFAKPSQAQDVTLQGVDAARPIYLTPYALGGMEQASQLNAAGTGFRQQRDLTREIGGDLRYNVTSNLTLDLTANTDFAQVEADPQRVNLTRFSLFFPEKRRFFQERASTFAFNTGGEDRLFNSRRIGLVNNEQVDGEPVRIWGGARLVGRVGDWDVGLIDMQTARNDRLGVPSENFGVMRLRRRVFNPTSYAGGIVTSRVGMDGTYNVAYGLDGVFRVTGDEYLTVKGAQTVDHAIVDTRGFDADAASLLLAQWERRRSEGLHYEARVTRAGANYRPDMGFITRQDFTELTSRIAYGRYPGVRSAFTSITPEASGSIAFRNEDGTVESASAEHEWGLDFKSGRSLEGEVEVRVEDLRRDLPLPENTTVPAGRYTFMSGNVGYESPDGQLLRLEGSSTFGRFYDGWQWGLELSPTWNPSRHLELEGTYNASLVRFPERNQRFIAHVARLRTQVALNKQVSTNAFLQYNSAASLATANVRFRYNFGEGNDLWIVYNEGFNLDRERTVPVLPWTDARSVLVKYTYTFRM
jgi:hypothetical protein